MIIEYRNWPPEGCKQTEWKILLCNSRWLRAIASLSKVDNHIRLEASDHVKGYSGLVEKPRSSWSLLYTYYWSPSYFANLTFFTSDSCRATQSGKKLITRQALEILHNFHRRLNLSRNNDFIKVLTREVILLFFLYLQHSLVYLFNAASSSPILYVYCVIIVLSIVAPFRTALHPLPSISFHFLQPYVRRWKAIIIFLKCTWA